MQRGLVLSSSSTASSLRCCCRKSVIHQKKSKSSRSQHNALLVRRAALFPVILLVALPVSTPYHNEILLLVHDTMYLIISFFCRFVEFIKTCMIYFYSFTIKTNMKKDGERKKKYILVCLWLSAFMDLLQIPTDLKGATCFALVGVGGRLCDLLWILQHVS